MNKLFMPQTLFNTVCMNPEVIAQSLIQHTSEEVGFRTKFYFVPPWRTQLNERIENKLFLKGITILKFQRCLYISH